MAWLWDTFEDLVAIIFTLLLAFFIVVAVLGFAINIANPYMWLTLILGAVFIIPLIIASNLVFGGDSHL